MFARLLMEGMIASSLYSLALSVVLFSMDASAALFRTPRVQGRSLYYMNILVVLAVSSSRYLIDKYDNESNKEMSVGVSTTPQSQQHVDLTDESLGVQPLHIKAQAIREAMFSPVGSARSAELIELAQSCVEGDRELHTEPDPAMARTPKPAPPQPTAELPVIAPPPSSTMRSPGNLPPIMKQQEGLGELLSDIWSSGEDVFDLLGESDPEKEPEQEERSNYVSEQVLSTLRWNNNQPTAV